MRVLVTDAEDRAALAAIRCLNDAGYEVTAVAGARLAAGHWSRACDQRVTLPHPRRDPAGFVDGVEGVLRAESYDVAMAGSDASLLAISSNSGRLEPHVRLGLPAHDVVARCFDKWELDRCAREAGLAGPETVLCDSGEEALEAARDFGFPVVVKSRRAVVLHGNAIRQRGSRPVGDEAALATAVELHGLPCLIQRRETGRVVSVGGVATDSGLLGLAFSRYSRVFPPDGGAVSFSQTIDPPPGLPDRVGTLVAALGWRGIFELELLERPAGLGAIDFNPRPYGSMSLAVDAGAALPALWCDHVLGRGAAGATMIARAGVHYRWEDADLRHMLWQLRRGRLGAALAVLRPHRNTVHSFFRLLDPLPLLARVIGMLRRRF